ncbi:vWA domain-containing protein [Photobacterium minamisatsumaniensis]|uniref:vWA domain-containing protein n=1 Tax=Photobacterium minamisatsumaniensis TaxID=2910233 RepID=UPI003D0F16B7
MADFTLLYPAWLWGLLPLVILLPWLAHSKSKQGLIAPHLAKQLGITENKQANKTPWLAAFWIIAVVAMSGPSWQKNTLPAYSLSGARVLVMDMSRSMYATDISPNRLTQARFKALDMLPGWKEGSTGLVTYAADGYTVSPLTQDSHTLANLIPHLSPEILPIQGSNAAAGILEAISLLKQAGHQQGDIILVTDGLSENESSEALTLLSGNKYRLSILAMGTTQGAPVKLPDGRLLSNNAGETVIAKVDIDTLLPLTQQTGGLLLLSKPTNDDVERLIAATAKPQEAPDESKHKELEERLNNGFWLLLPLIVLSLFGFRRGVVLALLITVMPIDSAYAASWKEPFKNDDVVGFELFEQGKFAEAAKHFNAPAWKGAAEYNAGDFESSIETLSPLNDERSRYNLANAYAQNQQFDQASEIYQKLIEKNPNNEDAKRNLALVEQLQKQQEQQKQSQQGNEQQNQSQDQAQDQQQASDSSQPDQDQQSNNPQEQESQSDEPSQQAMNNQEGSEQSNDASQQGENQQSTEQQNQSQGQSSDSAQQNAANEEQTDEQGGAQSKPQTDDNSQPSQAGATSDDNAKDESVSSASLSDDELNGEEEPNTQAIQAEGDASGEATSNGISASDPILKKLEQIPDDTAALIRAQMILQARQRQAPEATENSW